MRYAIIFVFALFCTSILAYERTVENCKFRLKDFEENLEFLMRNRPAPHNVRVQGGVILTVESDELPQWNERVKRISDEVHKCKLDLAVAQAREIARVKVEKSTQVPIHPSTNEIPLKTLMLVGGSSMNILSYMNAGGECRVKLLNGKTISLSPEDVKEIYPNHTLFQRYLNRTSHRVEAIAYQQLLTEQKTAQGELASLSKQLVRHQESLVAYEEAIAAKATNSLLDGRAEEKKNVAALKAAIKPIEAQLSDIAWDIAEFRDSQIYFALCDRVDIELAINALMVDYSGTQSAVVAKTTSARSISSPDPDRQKRMDAGIERERLARKLLIEARETLK